MADQNWRTEVNALDYFGNQKKQASLDNRRPVIRKPSDLVGPGIAANAIRLTDFNDHLATYDGFFSADVGALNAPNSTDAFVGTVTSDETLGGVQTFSGLTTQANYQRVFNRNPSDEATIYWGDWEIVGTAGTGGGTFTETLPASIIDAKGDLIVGAGDNAPVREAVGDDGESVVADSTTSTGIRWDTRVRTIVPAPDSSITVDNTDPLNPVIDVLDNGSAEWEWDDRATIAATGTQTPRLTYEPRQESLFVWWHPGGAGGLRLLSEDFTLDGQIVTIPDPGYFAPGDTFSFQYEHNPTPPLDLLLVGSVGGVFHTPANTMTFTPPVDTQEGDFFVISVRGGSAAGGGDITFGATTTDPRIAALYSEVAPPVAETIFTGFASASGSDVAVDITINPGYSPSAFGVMTVFRGVHGVGETGLGGGGVTPEVSGLGAVAVTWDGNIAFGLVSSGPPTGYTLIQNTGLNYSATALSYWFDPAGSSSPVGTYGDQGCFIIGLV